MVADGAPHQQKGWWTRGAGGQNYREATMQDKHMKPHQHAWRGFKNKLSEVGMGFGNSIDAVTGKKEQKEREHRERDEEMWRKVEAAPKGVLPATKQQAFNWPLTDDIS